MRKEEVKSNCIVMDRWYPELGTGIITDVKKTVFTVSFNSKSIKYDYPHCLFLNKISK